jgi:hypothetical protein
MTRTTKSDTTVCRNYCAYYKPGKNEDMMCQGFVVVHGILRGGKQVSLSRPATFADPGAAAIEGLRKRVCSACSFRRADCDYVLTGGTAVPCGGFALLSHLLGSGEVTLTDIDEAI